MSCDFVRALIVIVIASFSSASLLVFIPAVFQSQSHWPEFPWRGGFDVVPDSQADGVFWFVQVSDLHLSDMHPERAKDFELLCNQTLPVLQPELVLVT